MVCERRSRSGAVGPETAHGLVDEFVDGWVARCGCESACCAEAGEGGADERFGCGVGVGSFPAGCLLAVDLGVTSVVWFGVALTAASLVLTVCTGRRTSGTVSDDEVATSG